ncbi:MAG: hypothetical protein JW384_02173 [Nitrosomonadaceae bacterium]|nr:hypothetical protein [Nitrosomonadaceae bacterium]
MAEVVFVSPWPTISKQQNNLFRPAVCQRFIEHDFIQPESRQRIIIASANDMIRIKIRERANGKKMLVRWINIGPGRPEVGNNNLNDPPPACKGDKPLP